MPKRRWRLKVEGEEWNSERKISDAELLNRVILAKALQVHASGQTVEFRTEKENLSITPRAAEQVIKASGQHSTSDDARKRKTVV